MFLNVLNTSSVLDMMPLKAFEWAKLGKKLASYYIIITLVVELEQIELIYCESLPLISCGGIITVSQPRI